MNRSDAFALALEGKTAATVKKEIEARLLARLKEQGGYLTSRGALTSKAMQEQAAFIAGAVAGVHAVLGTDDKLPDIISSVALGWMVAIMRGEAIAK